MAVPRCNGWSCGCCRKLADKISWCDVKPLCPANHTNNTKKAKKMWWTRFYLLGIVICFLFFCFLYLFLFCCFQYILSIDFLFRFGLFLFIGVYILLLFRVKRSRSTTRFIKGQIHYVWGKTSTNYGTVFENECYWSFSIKSADVFPSICFCGAVATVFAHVLHTS